MSPDEPDAELERRRGSEMRTRLIERRGLTSVQPRVLSEPRNLRRGGRGVVDRARTGQITGPGLT